ncbi:GAK system CofD-like protein [Fundidesulfovibrio soli]|uniref:GAK system CofD-like protein n=1 Tax=Fundidesulfovibrio soli TaxID=2922716 RepID=UPI001FAF629C|nr:GAK system CofD-like protein [Fundidesulfovibrio soli]
MTKVSVTHTVTLPDPVRIARYLKAPELGPKALFFSGGTALRDLSRELVRYTHNSVHLITPFDSGGSSAKLRKSFHMLAVGDLRNRLMALADRTLHGNPQIYRLFAHRLPKDQCQDDLAAMLDEMISGKAPLVADVPDPMRKIIRTHLGFFRHAMRDHKFDLRGASIGNLILAGGFFNYNRQIDPVIYMFAMMVKARGTVRPIVNRDLTLAAELADGTVLAGQHLLTGKEEGPIKSPVKRVYLCASQKDTTPVEVEIRRKIKDSIRSSELICYPMGSFYSSLVANLLPRGVGDAVAKAQCPKVFVPNPAGDPEQLGLGLGESVRRLVEYLRASCSKPRPTSALLNFVMLDKRLEIYQHPLALKQLEGMGIGIIECDLASEENAPLFDECKVIEHLLSLA